LFKSFFTKKKILIFKRKHEAKQKQVSHHEVH